MGAGVKVCVLATDECTMSPLHLGQHGCSLPDMSTPSYIDPAAIVAQGNNAEDAAARRSVALELVIEGQTGTRVHLVDADRAWTYRNDAYDHASSAFETLDASDGAYYRRPRPNYVGDKHGAHR